MLFRSPYILVGITLFPLVVSTLFLDWNLSRILRRERVFWEGQIRESQVSQIIDTLRVRVDTAWDIVNHYYSEGLGQEACKNALSKISPNEDGYVYVQKIDLADRTNEILLVHPDKAFVGRPVLRVVDLERVSEIYYQGKVYPVGHPTVAGIQPTNVCEEISRICAKGESGMIHYYWARVVDGKASQIGYPKVAYIRYFPQWQWALGSGAYADHIDALVAEQVQAAMANAHRIRNVLISSTLVIALVLGGDFHGGLAHVLSQADPVRGIPVDVSGTSGPGSGESQAERAVLQDPDHQPAAESGAQGQGLQNPPLQ